jgi:hypothetical protein
MLAIKKTGRNFSDSSVVAVNLGCQDQRKARPSKLKDSSVS